LVEFARDLLLNGLAQKSRSSYHSGQKSFLRFCDTFGVAQPLPAAPVDVCMWLASLACRQLTPGTLQAYRWSLHALHTELGLPSIVGSDLQIKRMISGVEKLQGPAGRAPERLPVTPKVLRSIQPLLQLDSNADHRMLSAAMWTATCGLLRPGEVAVESARSTKRLLRVSSLTVRSSSPLRYTLHLAESKGDQHRLGVDIPIVGPDATAAIRDYLERRGPSDPSSPLFVFTNGTPLTHSYLVKRTAELAALAKVVRVDPSTGRPYAGVSFRKGGATWLSESGVEDRLVQKIGRWKSYCYARYIHPSDQTLDNAFATF
jgi:hypothetical protein